MSEMVRRDENLYSLACFRLRRVWLDSVSIDIELNRQGARNWTYNEERLYMEQGLGIAINCVLEEGSAFPAISERELGFFVGGLVFAKRHLFGGLEHVFTDVYLPKMVENWREEGLIDREPEEWLDEYYLMF